LRPTTTVKTNIIIMFKDLILLALKTKFIGVADATLIRICEKIAKAITAEDQIQTAVDAVTIPELLQIEGDIRVSNATKTAIENYEKKHGIKDGVKVEGAPQKQELNPETTPQNNAIPEWAKSFIEQQSTLMNEILNIKQGKTAETRKQQLLKAIENTPEVYRNSIVKNFERASFKDDDDFSNYLTELQASTEEVIKDFASKGAIFNIPQTQGGKTIPAQPSKEKVEEVLKQLNN